MRRHSELSFSDSTRFGRCLAVLIFSMLLFAAPAVAQAQTTAPLAGEPAQITESTDGDNIVDSIVIAAAGCQVEDDATVTVEDDDGTRVELTNGENVNITGGDKLTIVGTGTGGNLEGISPTGGDREFGTEGATVTGELVSSTGITSCAAGTNPATDPAGEGEGDGALPEEVCENIIAAVGDIDQGQSGVAAAVAGQYDEESGVAVARTDNASAAVAQAQGVTIAQVNECLNGSDDESTQTEEQDEELEGEVLTETIPTQKVLANTGGPALLLPALGLLLISSVAIRNLLRR